MKIISTKTKLRKYFIYIDSDITEKFPVFLMKNFSEAEKIVLVTNDKIINIYEKKVKDLLRKINVEHKIIIIKDGEKYKSLESTEYVFSKLVEFNVHRNDLIIAFGGGVIGDLTGFVASTYSRGTKFIQYPTTIISQVDSSVGGKVAVNYKTVKNMIGSFYQPHMVIIDPVLLYTLDKKQVINGMAEIVKYGIVFDKKILEIIRKNTNLNNNDRVLNLLRSKVFEKIIFKCCTIKARVVEKDEFDKGYRNLLNFGHTIGHCIENASNLEDINHGQAVSMGMIAAIDISIGMGLAKKQLKEDVIEVYKRLELPYTIPKLDVEKIMNALKYDKKFTSKINKFILIKGVGKPLFCYNIDNDIITESIKNNMESY